MGILDILGFGGTGPEKALKLKAKVTQKYGEPATRQKALQQLGEMRIPEAVSVLLSRFTISVDPQTTDADEKETTFNLIQGFGDVAVGPVKDFLERSDMGTSWALRLLEALLPEEGYVGTLTEVLDRLGRTYTRTHEKKVVLLTALEGRTDARIAPVVLPLLEDAADDVKVAALQLLGPLGYAPAREAILQLLANPETARRVQSAALGALAVSGFEVQDHRAQVQAALVPPYSLDASGRVVARS
ncbi:MAG: HEAT repeat domain-containing protein [Myxococcaceae bacterium]|nr:HEAT repeat domain-containing protein [Myxococcaceae bacterium]